MVTQKCPIAKGILAINLELLKFPIEMAQMHLIPIFVMFNNIYAKWEYGTLFAKVSTLISNIIYTEYENFWLLFPKV